jgi:mono/diheme cytochrome c family protein
MMEADSRTRYRGGVLVDVVRTTPVDREIRHYRRWFLFAVIAILLLVIGVFLARFNKDRPVSYRDPEQHFKYGSIGSEPGGSLADAVGGVLPPYWIFVTLPQVCPDKLPGGYESLGWIYEGGADLPIGVSRRYRLGFDQVGLNCASCHTGTYRASAGGERVVVPGMPSHQLELQGFFDFVLGCTLDERFTADRVIAEIERAGGDLDFLEKAIYRNQLVPRTREATLLLANRLKPILDNPRVTRWGHGRVDTFNPYKAIQFNWNLAQLPESELTGASDFPALWWQGPREGMQLHWDGNNTSLQERNLSASLGAGVTPVTIDHANLQRVAAWIRDLPPPKYPFPIDEAKAQRGAAIYAGQCTACHGDHRFREGNAEQAKASVAGTRVGTVEPIQAVGTDRKRLDSYTFTFASNQYTLYPDSTYQFKNFRKTNGYSNQPLDGLWARAPYLHNGSVPTLRDLLEPPERRPVAFYRGYDVYDPQKVGFITNVSAEGGRRFSRYDTRLPGNHNGGHLWGTQLSDDEKDALVEYMKTL